MTKNMGTLDRVIRTVAGLVIIGLYLTHRINGVVAIILGIVAVAFLASSAVGTCPAYLPLGISTRGKGTS